MSGPCTQSTIVFCSMNSCRRQGGSCQLFEIRELRMEGTVNSPEPHLTCSSFRWVGFQWHRNEERMCLLLQLWMSRR